MRTRGISFVLVTLLIGAIPVVGAVRAEQPVGTLFADPLMKFPRGPVSLSSITDNYPSRALREEKEGRVEVEYVVDATGSVIGCEVLKSSGHEVLDNAACKAILRRKFLPALDQAGTPTMASVISSMIYSLEPSQVKFAPSTIIRAGDL